MACVQPLVAARTSLGGVALCRKTHPAFYDQQAANRLLLPCGSCLGCRKARAREWALRCTLELSQHDRFCWTTLTYDREHKPPALRKDHLSGFLKRLRRRLDSDGTRVRFFASGEYGEQRGRPHYHAILYGVATDNVAIQAAWPFGHARIDPLTKAAISYVAGYVNKKIGFKESREERIDYITGECYMHEPPFVLMSRRPGIGAHARRFTASWRSHAVLNGSPMPVPRFLHEAWKGQATEEEILELQQEKQRLIRAQTRESLEAKAMELESLYELNSAKRRKL